MLSLPALNLPSHLSAIQKIFRRLRSGQLQPYAQLAFGRMLPIKLYEEWYWQRDECRKAFEILLECRPQLIHANDWMSLPLAIRAAHEVGAQVIADLHEYAPLEMNGVLWHLFLQPLREYVLRRYMPYTAASITVNQSIADRYSKKFGFQPIVILNAPKFEEEINFHPTRLDSVHLIHHGGAIPFRKLEWMIKALALADHRFHLHFMLTGDSPYVAQLKDVSNHLAPGRVYFELPVAPAEVVLKIASYDIGFYLLPPTSFNNMVALPNKFFEFIHAGLAICVGPSPEMKRLCEIHGFGVAAPSFSPRIVAQTLNRLGVDEIDKMKRASLQARNLINAEVENKKFMTLYHRLLDR